MATRFPTGFLIAFACSFGLHGVLVWLAPRNTSFPSSRLSQKSRKLIAVEILSQSERDFSISQSPVPSAVKPSEKPRYSSSSHQFENPAEQVPRISQSLLNIDLTKEDKRERNEVLDSAPTFSVPSRDGSNRPLSKDISPRAAALSVMDGLSPFCGPSDTTAKTEATEERHSERLQNYLSKVAEGRPYLKRRDAPKLRHQTDGRYRFEGHAFNAYIEKDGNAKFEDRSSTGLFPLFSSDTNDKADKNLYYGDFDLTDMIEKNLLDKETYTYEKRRFLRETAEQREKIARANRAAFDEKAKRRLLGRLILIKEDNSKTNSTKHERIFAIWDDCSGDRIGLQAQRLIERFIRDEMPRESALGFSSEEIRSFNRRRVSQRVFNPYKAQPSESTNQVRG